jgi:hypothetical protein
VIFPLVAGAMFMGLGAVAYKNVHRLWRRGIEVGTPPAWWPYGQRAWLSYVRSMPAAWVCVWPMSVAVLTGWSATADTSNRLVEVIFVVCVVSIVFSIGGVALTIVVALFGRPKWAVPSVRQAAGSDGNHHAE